MVAEKMKVERRLVRKLGEVYANEKVAANGSKKSKQAQRTYAVKEPR